MTADHENLVRDPQGSACGVTGLRRSVLRHGPVAIALGAGLLAVLASGCDETSGSVSQPMVGDTSTPSCTPPAALPELALSFQAGDSATERRITAAQNAVREHPNTIEAYTALATALLMRRRETSNAVFATYAQDVLTTASRRAPGDPQVALLTTMVLLDQHRFTDAAEKARLLTAALPNDPTPHLLLGDALLELGEYDDSADAVQDAMNLRPDLRSYNRAAHMRWLYGDFDGALTVMDLALGAGSSRDPEGQAWCFADLGTMYLARGDARRAAASADRALDLLPKYVPGMVVRAKAMAAQGLVDAAIATMSDAVERRPSAEDLLTLAAWLTQANRQPEAAQRRSQAERLSKADPRPMAHFLARMALRPADALTLAQQELAARHNIAAYDTYALALLRNDRLDEASHAIGQAMALGTKDADLHLHAGLIQVAARKPAAARASLTRALDLNPNVDPTLVSELRQDLLLQDLGDA